MINIGFEIESAADIIGEGYLVATILKDICITISFKYPNLELSIGLTIGLSRRQEGGPNGCFDISFKKEAR